MKLLLYCTKAKPQLSKVSREYVLIKFKDNQNVFEALNGKIVAECDFEVEKINVLDCTFRTFNLDEKEILNKSCLTYHELFEYLKNRDNPRGYIIHIKNLHIFEEPKELSEYGMDFPISPIVKAPQNMMYANGIGERYILISIRPEWLCKILNGEKTIEIRKKVLKGMLNNE